MSFLRSNSRWIGRAANHGANAKTVATARRSPRRYPRQTPQGLPILGTFSEVTTRLLVTYPTVGRGAGNLVDQNSASWNHVELWLSQLESLKRAS